MATIKILQDLSVFNSITAASTVQVTDLVVLSTSNIPDVTTLKSSSGSWNSVYSTVVSNSGYWGNSSTLLNTASARWDSTFSTVTANSAHWSDVYTVVSQNSASWPEATDPVFNTLTVNTSATIGGVLGVGTTTPDPAKALHVVGDVLVYGNLSANGDITFTNTLFTTTSALSITNTGTGPALVVTQTGAQDVASFYDDVNLALVIKDGGNVGIGTKTPNETLTVVGNISATGSLNIAGGGATTTLYVTDGLLGVNTASPNKALTVVGDISATGTIYGGNTINKFVSSFGDGASTEYVISHNLNSSDVVTCVRDNSTKELVYPSLVFASSNTVTVGFTIAPADNAYTLTVVG